jgi:endoglucanase
MSLIFLLLLNLFASCFGAPTYFGVNLSGGEWDTSGTYFPSNNTVNYFLGKGFNIIRLPFLWEGLQPTLGQPFAPIYFGYIDRLVYQITNAGAYVILDPHNYARYPYNGQVIGSSSSVTTQDYATFWGMLAAIYKNNSHVFFGLMNEPNTMATELWLTDANAAIAAIRQAGATNLILVPGNAWTGAHSWTQNWYGTANSVVMLNVSDPINNFVFEVHQYFDTNYSGTSPDCPDLTAGTSTFTAFIAWAQQNNYKAYLGEFAGGYNSNCSIVINNCLTLLNSNDVFIGWNWWAGGDYWGNYILSIQPTGTYPNYVDSPFLAWLKPFMNTQSQMTTQSQLTTQSQSQKSDGSFKSFSWFAILFSLLYSMI